MKRSYTWTSSKAIRSIGILAGLSATIGGTDLVMAVIGYIRSAMRGLAPWPLAGVGIIGALIAWVVLVAIPLVAVARAMDALKSATYLMGAAVLGWLVVAGASIGSPPVCILSSVNAMLLIASTCVASASQRNGILSARRDYLAPRGRQQQRAVRVARRLVIVAGPAGVHAFYLRQAWKGILLLLLLTMGFVSWPSPLAWCFTGYGMALAVLDYLAAPERVRQARVGLTYADRTERA